MAVFLRYPRGTIKQLGIVLEATWECHWFGSSFHSMIELEIHNSRTCSCIRLSSHIRGSIAFSHSCRDFFHSYVLMMFHDSLTTILVTKSWSLSVKIDLMILKSSKSVAVLVRYLVWVTKTLSWCLGESTTKLFSRSFSWYVTLISWNSVILLWGLCLWRHVPVLSPIHVIAWPWKLTIAVSTWHRSLLCRVNIYMILCYKKAHLLLVFFKLYSGLFNW